MINVSIDELKTKADCMYTVVAVVSKRANQVVAEATARGEALDKSAVTIAVEEFLDDKIVYFLPENYKNI